jgi:Holliday junction resolvase RusA-like endonuclease
MSNHPLTFCVLGLPRPAGSKRAFTIRKNGLPTGRIAVVDDCKESRDWKNTVAREAAATMQDESRQMLIGPVCMSAIFYVPRPKGHYRTGKRASELRPSAPEHPTTKPDLLKLTRAVEDALTGVVWRDDSQVVEHRLEKRYGSPSCTVQVSDLTAESA